MYKNPQLSAQAKRLRTELTNQGLTVSHAKALEILARVEGARTVHVAQAKNNAPVDINDLALKQASDLVFETLGRYAPDVRGLVESIRAAFFVEGLGSRYVEDAVFKIFETEDAPKVSATFDGFLLKDLPDVFDRTFARLKATLEDQARGVSVKEPSVGGTVFETVVHDWRLSDGESLEDLPEAHRQGFDLKVTRSSCSQLYVDMTPIGATLDQLYDDGLMQMSLFIEINDGRPCVHMTNAVHGDQVLTVFFTGDGLYLRPDTSDSYICTGIPSVPGLLSLVADLEAPFKGMGVNPSRNAAFIQTK